jgi:hypothetical protein
MNIMPFTYLCGGIQGLDDAQCNDWREAAKKLLNTQTLDPMRRDYRGVEDAKFVEIVEGDLVDITKSAFLLVNACRPSWGTAMEVVYAHMWNKPCIAFINPLSRNISPWLQYHGEIFVTLEGACERINILAERLMTFQQNEGAAVLAAIAETKDDIEISLLIQRFGEIGISESKIRRLVVALSQSGDLKILEDYRLRYIP